MSFSAWGEGRAAAGLGTSMRAPVASQAHPPLTDTAAKQSRPIPGHLCDLAAFRDTGRPCRTWLRSPPVRPLREVLRSPETVEP